MNIVVVMKLLNWIMKSYIAAWQCPYTFLLYHVATSASTHYTESAFIFSSRGINHRSTFHKHQLINSVYGIFDPLPSLQAPGTRVEFPNPHSSVKSLSAVRTITPEPTATSIA
jgi:hypothetical protein